MKVLLYGIARERIVLPSGAVLDLRSEKVWRKLVDTLKLQVPATRPPLYREHDERRPALGYVEEIVGPVRREQLTRAGVPARSLRAGEYIMMRAVLTPRGAKEYRAGDIARTSIGMTFDQSDETGRVWPFYLEELSVVDKPHIRVQPTAGELSRVALRAGRPRVVRLSGAVLRRDNMDAQQLIDRLMAFLAELAAEAVAVEETPEAIAEDTSVDVLAALEEDPEPEAMAYDDEDEEKEKLKARVAELEAKLSAQKLSARIARAGLKLSAEDTEALVRIGLTMPAEFDRVVERLAAAAPKRQERLAAAGVPKVEEPAPASRQEASLRKLAELAARAAAGGEA